MTKQFRITYTIDVTLSENDIWPDGDAPENPTAEQVAALIRKEGGFPSVLVDWNLDDGSDPFNLHVTEAT